MATEFDTNIDLTTLLDASSAAFSSQVGGGLSEPASHGLDASFSTPNADAVSLFENTKTQAFTLASAAALGGAVNASLSQGSGLLPMLFTPQVDAEELERLRSSNTQFLDSLPDGAIKSGLEAYTNFDIMESMLDQTRNDLDSITKFGDGVMRTLFPAQDTSQADGIGAALHTQIADTAAELAPGFTRVDEILGEWKAAIDNGALTPELERELTQQLQHNATSMQGIWEKLDALVSFSSYYQGSNATPPGGDPSHKILIQAVTGMLGNNASNILRRMLGEEVGALEYFLGAVGGALAGAAGAVIPKAGTYVGAAAANALVVGVEAAIRKPNDPGYIGENMLIGALLGAGYHYAAPQLSKLISHYLRNIDMPNGPPTRLGFARMDSNQFSSTFGVLSARKSYRSAIDNVLINYKNPKDLQRFKDIAVDLATMKQDFIDNDLLKNAMKYGNEEMPQMQAIKLKEAVTVAEGSVGELQAFVDYFDHIPKRKRFSQEVRNLLGDAKNRLAEIKNTIGKLGFEEPPSHVADLDISKTGIVDYAQYIQLETPQEIAKYSRTLQDYAHTSLKSIDQQQTALGKSGLGESFDKEKRELLEFAHRTKDGINLALGRLLGSGSAEDFARLQDISSWFSEKIDDISLLGRR